MYQLLRLYNDEWGTDRIVLTRRKYLSVREYLHARRIWLYNDKECDFTVHKWQSRDMLQREKEKYCLTRWLDSICYLAVSKLTFQSLAVSLRTTRFNLLAPEFGI